VPDPEIILLVWLIYFTPTIIAVVRKHHQPVGIVNLFLGWTFIGWVVALVWSLSYIPPEARGR